MAKYEKMPADQQTAALKAHWDKEKDHGSFLAVHLTLLSERLDAIAARVEEMQREIIAIRTGNLQRHAAGG